ncbi:hypothetical protein Tco_1056917 [Tanacetum coccineum]|uniref:Uncharacterized protein n=1 Tax=Tanacetum coccineum TaxID=301880 RepID=A0ABQ5H5C9_9ASTR
MVSAIASASSSFEYSWSENKLKSGDLNSSRLSDLKCLLDDQNSHSGFALKKGREKFSTIDIACEEYVQEVLETSKSGNPTSTSDLTIDSRSPSFTPFGGSDFLMEEIDEFCTDDSYHRVLMASDDFEGDTFT